MLRKCQKYIPVIGKRAIFLRFLCILIILNFCDKQENKIVWFQKTSIATSRRVIGNSKGEGDLKSQNLERKVHVWTEKPSVGGVFFGTKQLVVSVQLQWHFFKRFSAALQCSWHFNCLSQITVPEMLAMMVDLEDDPEWSISDELDDEDSER